MVGNGGKARGCGSSRDAGGIYLECGDDEGGGLPMWELIQDPVKSVDIKALGLSPVGVKLVEVDGVWHVFDWVGAEHYPNAADFIEEAVRLGISRRISRKEDFSKLTSASRLVLVHPRAVIAEVPDWLKMRECPCPTGHVGHDGSHFNCAGSLWHIAHPQTTDSRPMDHNYEPPTDEFPEWAPRRATAPGCTSARRRMPAFTYNVGLRVLDLELSPGIIMVAPIERLAVVNNPSNRSDTEEAASAAMTSTIPVHLMDN